MTRKTKRKIARENSATSTGTKSPVTIPNSSLNSLQHGANWRVLVLSNESTAQFQELLSTYIQKFLPADGVGMKLVEEMVAAKWRQQRIWVIQTTALDLEMNSQRKEFQDFEKQNDRRLHISEASHLALSFTAIANKEKTLELLHRHETGYARMHDRAMKTLCRLRKDAKLQNDPKPPEPTVTKSESEPPNPKIEVVRRTPSPQPAPSPVQAEAKLPSPDTEDPGHR